MAIVLTGFFAVGVVLVSRQASFTSDLTAFLFGRILTVDRQQLVVTAVIGAAGAAAARRCWARSCCSGRSTRPARRPAATGCSPLDLVLNLAVALVVVAAVRAVGTVLVIALLVVPGAAGRLLSDRLAGIMLIAVGIALLAGWLGLVASYEASVNHGLRLASGATVVLVLVLLYGLAAAIAAARKVRA